MDTDRVPIRFSHDSSVEHFPATSDAQKCCPPYFRLLASLVASGTGLILRVEGTRLMLQHAYRRMSNALNQEVLSAVEAPQSSSVTEDTWMFNWILVGDDTTVDGCHFVRNRYYACEQRRLRSWKQFWDGTEYEDEFYGIFARQGCALEAQLREARHLYS